MPFHSVDVLQETGKSACAVNTFSETADVHICAVSFAVLVRQTGVKMSAIQVRVFADWKISKSRGDICCLFCKADTDDH